MLRNLIFLLLIGMVLMFVMQNVAVVQVRFLFWEVSMSRALMLIATLAVGLVGGWLIALPRQRKGKPPRRTGGR